MKVTVITSLAFVFVFALTSCSRNDESPTPKLIEITGNNEMKFDVTSSEVKPG